METRDVVHVPLSWTLAELGEHLRATGHTLTSREVAQQNSDPFKHGKLTRWEALAVFVYDMDDKACYPNAGLHMIPHQADMVRRYIKYKDVILLAIGVRRGSRGSIPLCKCMAR